MSIPVNERTEYCTPNDQGGCDTPHHSHTYNDQEPMTPEQIERFVQDQCRGIVAAPSQSQREVFIKAIVERWTEDSSTTSDNAFQRGVDGCMSGHY